MAPFGKFLMLRGLKRSNDVYDDLKRLEECKVAGERQPHRSTLVSEG